MNPFTFGNPIKDTTRFIGRKAEIRQILNRLLSSAHESTSIIGERRIGKTSLLKYLADSEIAADLGLTSDKYCLVYVDFQGKIDITPQRFWQQILKTMSRSIPDENVLSEIKSLISQDSFDMFDLEYVFDIVMEQGLTTVLFLDEFEEVTKNPNFTGDFFGGLRTLALHHGLVLIPATRSELVDLCHSEEIKGSPFFNIFANVILRPFSQDEVDEMVCTYLEGSGYGFTHEEKDWIWDLSGGYPFFTQIAGHYLFDGKQQSLDTEALKKSTRKHFDRQAEAHFKYLWSHSSESEKITVLIILTLELTKASKKTVPNLENLIRLRARAKQDLNSLNKRGIVHEINGLYSLFSTSFAYWVRQEILAIPGEEETEKSAKEWIKSGGQKDVREAVSILPRFRKEYWPIVGELIQELSINLVADGAKTMLLTLM